ncbi:hypothetical protein OS242_09780 [Tumebacillus sp. DT12]|uniref:Uncharacterized protein n=1 Tax=Tumebacillus lacus TaxID=2995335 RepID=A0ABT3X1C5_9BACL|nr:hypothetical protein [Tumebacillus lacus]MCX7570251.1 hypothetical protein [Tumebacillus lacus]
MKRRKGLWVQDCLPCRSVSLAYEEARMEEPTEESARVVEPVSNGCVQYVHKKIRVEALVTVKPTVGLVKGAVVSCRPVKRKRRKGRRGPCTKIRRTSHRSCTFRVSQDLMVKIPLKFGADVSVEPGGTTC